MNSLLSNNTLIKQVEQRLESQISPQVRDAYMRIVVAGMKVAMDKGEDGLMASIAQSNNPLNDIVKGTLSIVGALRSKANGTMPVNAMILAGMALVLQGLDFADRTGIMKVTATEIDQATHLYTETLFSLLKISPSQIASALKSVDDVRRDPTKMAKLQGTQNGAA
jgi:hypothetical protein